MYVSHDTPRYMHPYLHAVIPYPDRPPRSGVPRDPFAGIYLTSILASEGFALGDPYLNFPSFTAKGEEPSPEPDLEAHWKPGDIFLQPTRVPLDDEEDDHRKRVPRGFTDLEARMFFFWQQFLGRSSRSCIQLSEHVKGSLLPGYEGYANMEFFLNGGGCDIRFIDDAGKKGQRGAPPKPGSVAAFLRTEAMWPGGPGLCAAFGMNANATAAWSWILYHRMRDLTKRRGFFLASLSAPPVDEFRGSYAAIASEWKAELMLEHPFYDEF